MSQSNIVRWLVAAVAALAIIGLVAYERNGPGVGGRVPDPEDVRVVVVESQ
jgi:hypothetical protein